MAVSESFKRFAYLLLTVLAVTFAGCSEKRGADMPNFTRCSGPAECVKGYACRSGICISPAGQAETSSKCTVASDCPAGLDCVEGKCVANMTGCSDDLECGFGEICEDGQCQPGRSTRSCTTDADCAGGSCINRRCR